ncbi:hypothetical protein CR513_32506, partial [Mucuna pruriens]
MKTVAPWFADICNYVATSHFPPYGLDHVIPNIIGPRWNQLANRSIVQPLGVLEDVLVHVNELIFPADFYVLDIEDETSGKESTLILG